MWASGTQVRRLEGQTLVLIFFGVLNLWVYKQLNTAGSEIPTQPNRAGVISDQGDASVDWEAEASRGACPATWKQQVSTAINSLGKETPKQKAAQHENWWKTETVLLKFHVSRCLLIILSPSPSVRPLSKAVVSKEHFSVFKSFIPKKALCLKFN